MEGKTYSPMWYLYMLIGLYLMMPMYRSLVKVSNESEIKFILMVYVLFLSIIPIIGSFKFDSGFYIHELTIYPFYIFVGYVLNKGIIKIKRHKCALLFIASTIVIVLLTYIRWTNNYENIEMFWSYSSVFVIIQSAGIFNTIMGSTYNLDWQEGSNSIEFRSSSSKVKKLFSSLLLKIDNCSFGIYLTHIIFLRIFVTMNFAKSFIYNNSIFVILTILVIINLLLSYITTKFLKNIPIFRFIL